MRAFEDSPSVSASPRGRAVAAFWGCCVAILLLALAASAQEEAPVEPREPDTASADYAGETGDAEIAAEGAGEIEEAEDALEEGQYSVEDLEDFQEPFEALPSEGIEEITVTSERGMGTPQDAPISTVGFDSEVILKEGIKDIRDLSNFTPSLEIKSAFAASNPTIFIRGVGLDDFNANAASAVAIYQDGVYMQSPAGQLFQFFDVEGVEVLRGPQPALYRNASAGAILMHSNRPTDEFETFATVTLGNYRNVELVSAISGPIVPDWLSGRLSGTWGVRDGITKNRCPYLVSLPTKNACDTQFQDGTSVIAPGMSGRTNDMDAYAVRAQLLLKPPMVDAEWLLNAHGGQNFGRAYQYQHTGVQFDQERDELRPGVRRALPSPPPRVDWSKYKDTDGDFFAGDYNVDGPEKLDLWGVNLKGVLRFGEAYEVESLTAYEWHDRYILENTDANPNLMLQSEYADTAWQVSQELNLRGEWAESGLGDGSWIVGAYYLQEDLDVANYYDQSGSSDLIQEYSQLMRNFATYAQSTYKVQPGCQLISCDFTLETGLRYNLEYKEFSILSCGTLGGNCATTLTGIEDDLWKGLGGSISLAWHFYEENNVYLKYSHGWKGGHFNGGATGRFDLIRPVKPEIVDSYSAGIRSLWFDDRLEINVESFWYDYQDLQVFQLEQTPAGFPIAQLVNAEHALVYGIELDMSASPLSGMNITYNFSWVESEYLEFTVGLPFLEIERLPGGRRIERNFEEEFDYSGNPLIASPRLSMTASVDYKIPLPSRMGGVGLGYITPRFSFSWKDDVFFDASRGMGAMMNFPEATFGQKAFWIFNAGLSWLSDSERIELTGWVHNILDNHYKTSSFDISRGYQLIIDAYADPRTYGVMLSLSF